MRSIPSCTRLFAVTLTTASLGVDRVRAESSDSNSTTVIYIVVGVVVLLFVGVGVFLWTHNRGHNKDTNLPVHDTAAVSLPSSSQQQPRSGNDYRAHASPAARNGNANAFPKGPSRAQPREVEYGAQAANPNAPPPPPRRPAALAHQRPQRASETAARVLAEIQADPELARLKIPYAALSFTCVLYKGAFGEVWLAHLANRQVVVQRIRRENRRDEEEIKCFAAEIKVMTSIRHPKIVELVGVSWDTPQDLCAVAEYMVNKDLYGYLKRSKGKLNWREHKIYVAEDVADALHYLQALTPKVIHRDLKSKNILLDDSIRAKLSNFGINRQRIFEETTCAGIGVIYWTAPEVLMGNKNTEKADIYSFGIVMSEIDTHEVPYSDMRDEAGKKLQGMKIVQQVIKKKLRPTFTDACPDAVRELAARCLDADPNERPDAVELLHRIQEIQQQLLQ